MPKTKKTTEEEVDPKPSIDELLAKIEAQQEQIKTLYEVADKGRLMQHESRKTGDKKPMKVHLSKYAGGIITGWRTMKDILIKNPTTGLVMGEEQQYELIITGNDGEIKKVAVDGYPAFSAARYNERVECEVMGKKEDFQGNVTFDVVLPDGRSLPVDSRFVN